jgi:hypothetical protein
MMQSAAKQQGLTAITMLLILIIGGFLLLLAMKIGPIYLDHYKVKSIISNLAAQPNVGSRSRQQIQTDLWKRFYVNEIRDLDKNAVKLKKVGAGMQLELDYEVRKNILANVDAIVSFKEKVELK